MQRGRAVAAGVALVVVGLVAGAGATLVVMDAPRADADTTGDEPAVPAIGGDGAGVAQFESEAAFAAYVQRGQQLASTRPQFTRTARPAREEPMIERQAGPTAERPVQVEEEVAMEAAADGAVAGGDGTAGGGGGPDRVSGTNVQVAGLQEPDRLKTDDSHVYYAPDRDRHRPVPRRSDGQYRPREDGGTYVVSAESPADPAEVAAINTSGRLFRSGDTLVVIEDDRLLGYDMSDPADPARTWSKSLEDEVVTARLANGTVYLVTRSDVSMEEPCPIEPLDGEAAVACTDVYRPDRQVPVDATYSALTLDAATGAVGDTVAFVGTSDNTAVYMSANALYVTYTHRSNEGDLRLDFLLDTQDDRLPAWAIGRLREIRGYNISAESKRREADQVLTRWLSTLDPDRRERIGSEIRNDYRSYLADRQRDLLTTGVVRVGVSGPNLTVESVGTVPGRPLNQFSLSEHEGALRITTTVPAAGSAQSANDLYTLDSETLERRGEVTGMGINEEVFGVRYAGETAYIVTFRRIDPFHVVDLSDPDDPEEVGELELPGFSTYLHPIDDDHVLGIGEESGQVKAVLFDVSDPADPTIADDYVLDARRSAVADSHHAFLLDRKHGVFVLPTSDGATVVDYTDGDLSLETTVATDGPADRSMYVDDYLYVFDRSGITVVDEPTWNRTATVDLD